MALHLLALSVLTGKSADAKASRRLFFSVRRIVHTVRSLLQLLAVTARNKNAVRQCAHFFKARQHHRCILAMVAMSVCPFVCHTLAFCRKDLAKITILHLLVARREILLKIAEILWAYLVPCTYQYLISNFSFCGRIVYNFRDIN